MAAGILFVLIGLAVLLRTISGYLPNRLLGQAGVDEKGDTEDARRAAAQEAALRLAAGVEVSV